ncbi:MAG TPA: XRE family transcriptional regulator [Polyangiaceae bacterium]
MSPEEIKALRKELNCTARELATALKLEQKEVVAWEAGELFPTKRSVLQMEMLRKKGPSAIPRTPRGAKKTGVQRLDDPKLWELVRKLLEHPALFDQVVKLAEQYADPAKPAPAKAKEDA